MLDCCPRIRPAEAQKLTAPGNRTCIGNLIAGPDRPLTLNKSRNTDRPAMPIHYLLPCPNCEHPFSLTTSQAGQPLECPECGFTSDAPRLGTLKRLPVREGTSAAPTSAGNGQIGWKRHVFVLGLVTAVAAGISGVALYLYSQSLFTPADVEGHINLIDQDLDQCSPVVLWDIWHDPSRNFEEGLGEWAEPRYARYNKQSAILKNFAYGLLGLAGLGVLTLLASFAMKK